MLDTKGITQTSANYLANIAKERVQKYESELENLNFLNCKVRLIGSDSVTDTEVGNTEVKFVNENLQFIGQAKAFCAYVRESIKEKEELLNTVKRISFKEYCEKNNINLPSPELEEVEEEDIIRELPLKLYQEYLYLEAMASAYGKCIHPGESYSLARKKLHLAKPNVVKGEGRDTVVYSYTPSISVKEVDKEFEKLQNTYREFERKLNALKYDIKEKTNQRNLELNHKYQIEYAEYKKQYDLALAEYHKYITEETSRIANLKIVIPDRLQSFYEFLNSIGTR